MQVERVYRGKNGKYLHWFISCLRAFGTVCEEFVFRYRIDNFGGISTNFLNIFKLRKGASLGRFVGWLVCGKKLEVGSFYQIFCLFNPSPGNLCDYLNSL